MFTLLNSENISQHKYNYQKLFNRVNKELGPGFLVPIGILRESIYHKALEIRFAEEKIKFSCDELFSKSNLDIVEEIFSVNYIAHADNKKYTGQNFIKKFYKELHSAIDKLEVKEVVFLQRHIILSHGNEH